MPHRCYQGVIYEPDPDAGPIPQPCPNYYCPRCDRRWANCECHKERHVPRPPRD